MFLELICLPLHVREGNVAVKQEICDSSTNFRVLLFVLSACTGSSALLYFHHVDFMPVLVTNNGGLPQPLPFGRVVAQVASIQQRFLPLLCPGEAPICSAVLCNVVFYDRWCYGGVSRPTRGLGGFFVNL